MKISRSEVLENLIRFREALPEASASEKDFRKYKALLNCKTGDMRFAQKISALEKELLQNSKKGASHQDWKEIVIVVHDGSMPAFEVVDAKNHPLNPKELDPLAWKVASETISILNFRAKEDGFEKGPIEKAVLRDFSQIHLIAKEDQIEGFPGWMGSLTRLEAEKRLEGKKIGTYLLREGDEITLSCMFHLQEENLTHIRSFLMTVVQEEAKISDILLLKTDQGWSFYHDDPNLHDLKIYRYFPSFEALLDQLRSIAAYPYV